MRILKSNLLNDGKLFNDGRPVDLIQIEDARDYDTLLSNIINSNYYDSAYFKNHIDYPEGQVKFDALYLAAIIAFLKPRSLLELGCGRGDVLFLLSLLNQFRVQGIDLSRDILKKAWPPLAPNLACGELLESLEAFQKKGLRFNTFCGFDIWEHLHPRRLHDTIAALAALAEEDAFFFFIIPAIGTDKVFGEIFPLELEENHFNFSEGNPFNYLNAEIIDPPIPANGHLIWAPTEWWQKQFEQHGLVRAEEIEINIHHYFDEHLFYAQKSFFLFHRNSGASRRRIRQLSKNGLTLFKKWRILLNQAKRITAYEQRHLTRVINGEELASTLHHAEFYMSEDMERRIGEISFPPSRRVAQKVYREYLTYHKKSLRNRRHEN